MMPTTVHSWGSGDQKENSIMIDYPLPSCALSILSLSLSFSICCRGGGGRTDRQMGKISKRKQDQSKHKANKKEKESKSKANVGPEEAPVLLNLNTEMKQKRPQARKGLSTSGTGHKNSSARAKNFHMKVAISVILRPSRPPEFNWKEEN